MTDTMTRPVVSTQSESKEVVVHLTSCHNDNFAMCGARVSNSLPSDTPVGCEVCDRLDLTEFEGCNCICCMEWI